MHVDSAIRPVVQWPPSADVTVLHLVENLLDDELPAVGPDYLRVGSLLVAGDENRLAQI
jgi:hypothetical protein